MLKPCPFCGSEAHLQHVDYRGDFRCSEYEVICDNQECQGEWIGEDGQSSTDVIKIWNHRTLPSEVQAVMDAAEDFIAGERLAYDRLVAALKAAKED